MESLQDRYAPNNACFGCGPANDKGLRIKSRPDGGGGLVTHTNHCEHPELVAINEDFPELIQSHARKRRIGEIVGAGTDAGASLDEVQTALRDHQDHPRSICRHSNDDPNTGFWQTVFSVIIEPEQRRMHVSRGTPCDHSYETYEMA